MLGRAVVFRCVAAVGHVLSAFKKLFECDFLEFDDVCIFPLYHKHCIVYNRDSERQFCQSSGETIY
jgi:hypothetical protein